MNKPIVSIIVPVYNVENYLRPCLDSILAQTFIDFEVILVDDGSTDNSGRICDGYAKKDNRFVVYHKQNGGVSTARNFALDKIKGEWVYFCDADDILFEDALEFLTNKIGESVDCTMGGYIKINEQGDILEENKICEEYYLTLEEVLTDFYDAKCKMFNGYIWNRLFRRSIIEKYHIRFREDIFIKEDGLFLLQYLCKCNNGTYYNTKPIYKYIEHSSSAMNNRLNTINKQSISRLIASIECYKEVKKAGYNNILSFAKNNILFIRQQLLITDKSRGFNRLKFRIFIDKMITNVLSPLSLINVYIQKFRLAKR